MKSVQRSTNSFSYVSAALNPQVVVNFKYLTTIIQNSQLPASVALVHELGFDLVVVASLRHGQTTEARGELASPAINTFRMCSNRQNMELTLMKR